LSLWISLLWVNNLRFSNMHQVFPAVPIATMWIFVEQFQSRQDREYDNQQYRIQCRPEQPVHARFKFDSFNLEFFPLGLISDVCKFSSTDEHYSHSNSHLSTQFSIARILDVKIKLAVVCFALRDYEICVLIYLEYLKSILSVKHSCWYYKLVWFLWASQYRRPLASECK